MKLIINQQRNANTGKEFLQTSTNTKNLKETILGTNIDVFPSRETLQDTGCVCIADGTHNLKKTDRWGGGWGVLLELRLGAGSVSSNNANISVQWNCMVIAL